MRYSIVCLTLAVSLAGCAVQPSQADLEIQAHSRVVAEQVRKGELSASEGELARQQYAGNVRARESSINAANGFAQSQAAYAQNSGILTGAALYCAGQRGGHC